MPARQALTVCMLSRSCAGRTVNKASGFSTFPVDDAHHPMSCSACACSSPTLTAGVLCDDSVLETIYHLMGSNCMQCATYSVVLCAGRQLKTYILCDKCAEVYTCWLALSRPGYGPGVGIKHSATLCRHTACSAWSAVSPCKLSKYTCMASCIAIPCEETESEWWCVPA